MKGEVEICIDHGMYLVCDQEGDCLAEYPTYKEALDYCSRLNLIITKDATKLVENFGVRINNALKNFRNYFVPNLNVKKVIKYLEKLSGYELVTEDSTKDLISYDLIPTEDNELNQAFITLTNEDGGTFSYNIVNSLGDSRPVKLYSGRKLNQGIIDFEKDLVQK